MSRTKHLHPAALDAKRRARARETDPELGPSDHAYTAHTDLGRKFFKYRKELNSLQDQLYPEQDMMAPGQMYKNLYHAAKSGNKVLGADKKIGKRTKQRKAHSYLMEASDRIHLTKKLKKTVKGLRHVQSQRSLPHASQKAGSFTRAASFGRAPEH